LTINNQNRSDEREANMNDESKETAVKCLNTRECPCPKTDCVNRTLCCACVERHVGLGNLPSCLRKEEKEEKQEKEE